MADGIVTLPRAGTVDVVQEFGSAPAAPARPTLSAVILASCFQILKQIFAGFYVGKINVADEFVGTGNNILLVFNLVHTPVLTSTVKLYITSILGTQLTVTTHYTVSTGGVITLTVAGRGLLGTNALHAVYSYDPAQTYVYPEIKEGATVENPGSTVKVFLRTVEDIFDITDGFSVVIGPSTVQVPGNLQPSREVTTAHGQISVASALSTIVDTAIDFFALGVRSGDIVQFITDPAELQFSDSIVSADGADHVVLSIPSRNSVTINPAIASQGGKVEYRVIRRGTSAGDILIDYTARRTDKQGLLLEYSNVTDVDTDIGPIVPANPLAFGLSKALGATDKTVFGMMVPDQDNLVDHQKALDILGGEEVYNLVPLTNNRAIHQLYLAHAIELSEATSMHERRTIVTQKAVARHHYQDQKNTGSALVGSQVFTDVNAKFITNGVPVGAVISLVSPAQIELANVLRTELIIQQILSETQVQLIQAVTFGTQHTVEAVGTGDAVVTVFNLIATQNVVPVSVVIFFNGVQQSALNYTVLPNGQVTFLAAPGLGVVITASYEVSTITGIQYTVESQDLTNFEIAKDVAAVGEGYHHRRITVTHADIAIDDQGNEIEPYFLNCALAGLLATLPANQPVANIPIPGFLGIKHIRKFTDTHFGIMAAGGVAVYIQDRDTSPIVLRNAITTDTTNVLTREISVVDLVDFYSKFLRNNIQAVTGRFNITQNFIDNMIRPGINGVNRECQAAGLIGPKTQIVSIEQSQLESDRLFVIEELDVFKPANRVTITVRVI